MPKHEFEVRKAYSHAKDEAQAVRELRETIGSDKVAGLIFFCSSLYDHEKLAAELESTFNGPIAGCTTAGEISPIGYLDGAITAVAFLGDGIEFQTYAINPLEDVAGLAERIGIETCERLDSADDTRAFGLLLVDGLSIMEEQVTAHVSNALGGVPLIGGSAGDDMRFSSTYVYADGCFQSDSAVVAIATTNAPFVPFRTQHFVETDNKMVVTGAIPERRIVTEINGEPAAWEYARSIGLEVNELAPMIFSKYPVMLRIGGEYYVRSIQKVNDDGSLTFFCAIDEGLVLTIARGEDIIANLEEALDEVKCEIREPRVILGCDCILRKLEMKETGLLERVGEIMADNNVIGFSTYGEQVDSVHVNQTFTGIAIA